MTTFRSAGLVQETIIRRILAARDSSARERPFPIIDIRVSVHLATAVIDVATRPVAAVRIGSHLHAAVIAGLPVVFQDDIDDTRRPLGAILGRRVRYHFHLLDILRRHHLQDVGLVVGSQAGGFSVNPDRHAGIAAQGYLSLVVHLHRRDVGQQIARRAALGRDVLRRVEHLAVDLEAHLRLFGHDLHLAQPVGVFHQRQFP